LQKRAPRMGSTVARPYTRFFPARKYQRSTPYQVLYASSNSDYKG